MEGENDNICVKYLQVDRRNKSGLQSQGCEDERSWVTMKVSGKSINLL